MKKCVLTSLFVCAVGFFAPNALLQPAFAQTNPQAGSPIDRLAPFPAPLAGPLYTPPQVPPPPPAPLPVPTQVPTPRPTAAPAIAVPPPVDDTRPPTAQAYVNSPSRDFDGQVFVPASFFSSHLGASVGPVGDRWRLAYFNHQIDFLPWQRWIVINGKQGQLPTMTRVMNGQLYLPLAPFASVVGMNWNRIKNNPQKSVFLIQFPATYIENVRSSVVGSKIRTVLELSNPTRVQAFQNKLDAGFVFAGARSKAVPTVQKVGDYLVPRTTLQSGNWNANFAIKLNYSAPISWFTLGNPPRLVIDAQRLFEQRTTENKGGIALTKIRRGTGHGPVQMWVARLDPKDGWRVRVQPGGYSVLQRSQPSRLAARHKAVLAINGGFFAYDGAAVGAVLVDGEWIRLPWQGRTAVGFGPDGRAHIDNLQVESYVDFSGGLRIPIRDLNGWPDKNRVTALTRRFGTFYQLRPGEMALVVKGGKVIARPGGGGANIPVDGFTLVANGGARPWLQKVTLGQRAKMTIRPKNWPQITTALGGGPRLVKNGKIEVTSENFRVDVKNGAGPRTAFGVDKQGRYILLTADGRQKFHSTGLTLNELAATMQRLGAVHAMNLDGGGSTALAVRGKLINRPSDGRERSVANALLVMR